MNEFVFDEDVETIRQVKGSALEKMRQMATGGNGNNLNVVPLRAQVSHQLAIVEIAPAHEVQRAVNDQPNLHGVRQQRDERQEAEKKVLGRCRRGPGDLVRGPGTFI